MILIPAIDLKNNVCVRLTKGDKNTARVFNKDPVEQAKFFEKEGCKRIHIVDLDAAFGNTDINRQTILNIRKSTKLEIELGGGIKNQKDASFWIDNKIDFLVLGSLAAKDINATLSIIDSFKDKIYISLDHLNERIMISGWEKESAYLLKDFIKIYNKNNIKGYIITDVSRDGMLEGINTDYLKKILSYTQKNMIVGGGLSSYNDLENLKNLKQKNLYGIIAGIAFYAGKIEIKKGIKIVS